MNPSSTAYSVVLVAARVLNLVLVSLLFGKQNQNLLWDVYLIPLAGSACMTNPWETRTANNLRANKNVQSHMTCMWLYLFYKSF